MGISCCIVIAMSLIIFLEIRKCLFKLWIETDEKGEEHRYLGWGNNRFFVCELNEDMISIKDQDSNPDNLSVGYGKGHDIVVGKMNGKEIFNDQDKFEGHSFTEAPYYYRQQDENGNYYGPYYMFFTFLICLNPNGWINIFP